MYDCVCIIMCVCLYAGVVEEACLPYSSLTQSSSPSREEMKEIVVTRDMRPPIPEHWNRNEVDFTRHLKHEQININVTVCI